MDVKNFEFILKAGNTPLPDVVLLYLTKHYLNEKDCVSLVVTGASDRFTFLFWDNRKRLTIGQCYFLTPIYSDRLFKQYFSPLSLTSFDVSHGYWLPAKLLLKALVQMHNIEELSIQDTKLSLAHLLQVFQTCKKILKLGINLHEANLDAYQKDAESFSQGFGRLTQLKIFNINQSTTCSVDSWLVTLGVMSWCRDCLNLLIQIAVVAVHNPNDRQWVEQLAHNNAVLRTIRHEFKSKLGWLKSLKSLVIILDPINPFADPENYAHGDPFVEELLNWMFVSQDLLPRSLESLWIPQEYSSGRVLTFHDLHAPFVKSLYLWREDGVRAQLNHPKFSRIEHLGGIHFSNSQANMTQLKYVDGHCDDDHGMSEFCKLHPNLEYLYFNTEIGNPEDYHDGQKDYSIGNSEWTLPKLKTLGYYSFSGPAEDVMGRLIGNCRNISVLHLAGALSKSYSLPMGYNNMNHLGRIQFHNLVKLTLDSFEMGDGSFLVLVVKQCPNLQSLLIAGSFTPGVFFSNLGKCLPFAKNVRDLRLEWRKREKVASILHLLKNLLDCSDHLERLVLRSNWDINSSQRQYWKCSSQLENLLVGFATEMDRLVALCFAGFRVAPEVVLKVNRRIERDIIPQRPAFWFHLGDGLPKANDLKVPRIHVKEIVDPINIFCPDAPINF